MPANLKTGYQGKSEAEACIKERTEIDAAASFHFHEEDTLV